MRFLFLIALVVAVGVVFFGMGQAYRSDEVWSLQTVAQPWPDMMDDLRADIHPPLYYWMLRGWTAVFGASELASRSLSGLLHLLAAVALFAAARAAFGDGAGYLAAAILVVSPLGLLAAQFVRMYALLELSAALSIAAFLGAERSRWRWSAYVAANVAGSFTHVWFFFLLGAQILVAAGLRRWRSVAAAILSIVPYAILWLPVMLSQFGQTGEGLAWLQPPGISDLFEAVLMQGGAWWLLAPVAAIAAWRHRHKTQNRTCFVLFAVFGVTLAVPFVLSFVKPVFWARFTVAALPALALAGAGITLPKDRRTAAALVLLLGAALHVGQANARREECSSRWTAEWLARNTRPGDTVIFTNLSRLATDFYWDQSQPQRPVRERSFPAEIDSHPGFEGTLDRSALEAEARGLDSLPPNSRVFVLRGSSPLADEILLARLDSVATLDSPACVECAATNGNYYDRISVFEVR